MVEFYLCLLWLEKTGTLKRFLPELVKGKGVRQGGWHSYDVFGSPTYIVDGELFWGQDRIEFLARHLSA